MNKYQESLNTIKRCCEDRDGCYCSSIERLQELIYHCEALEKQFADQHSIAMNEYSIAYTTRKDGMMFETVIAANNEKDALNKLFEQLGKDFYYDEIVLEGKIKGE